MSIDFNNQDSRIAYLSDKLDDLLSGINNTYGQLLFDELMIRMQRTVDDFNEEIAVLTEEVKGNSDKRAEIIHTLMEGQDPESANSTEGMEIDSQDGTDSEVMSEWEKRLEGLV